MSKNHSDHADHGDHADHADHSDAPHGDVHFDVQHGDATAGPHLDLSHIDIFHGDGHHLDWVHGDEHYDRTHQDEGPPIDEEPFDVFARRIAGLIERSEQRVDVRHQLLAQQLAAGLEGMTKIIKDIERRVASIEQASGSSNKGASGGDLT